MKWLKQAASFKSIPGISRWRLKRNTLEKRTFSKIDYYRLQNILTREHQPAYQAHAKRMTRLRGLLLRGQMCPCKQVPAELVTMNSKVRLESKRGTVFAVTLVYPCDADPANRKHSVLSTIGLELIGKRQGDRFLKGMRIAEILYQPESTGKYYI